MKHINKYLQNITPYSLASHRVWEVTSEERKSILKLDWNESTIPPSPKVKERLERFLHDENIYFLYPSVRNVELLSLLSRYVGLSEENIQYFPSSDTLQEYLVKLYLSVDDKVLILGPTYDNFRLSCESQGAHIFYSNYHSDFSFDETNLLEAIQTINPRIVYICNPNNPSGNVLSISFIKLLLSKFVDTIFFLDEAYFEFSGITVAHEVECYDNLFVSRTFSKAFGIANFRAGYLISSKENITNMSLVRNAKNISTFTQEAMIGVLSDLEYMRSYVEEVKNARSWIISEIRKFDFIKTVFESQANFILVEFFEYDVKLDVLNNLERNKIYVRNLTHSDILKNCLRITVGLKSQMIRVVNSFKQEDV